MNKNLERRLDTTVRASYIRRWYQKPWGKVFLVIGLILAGFFVYYLYLTTRYVNDIKNFDINKTVTDFRQDKQFANLVTSDDPSRGSAEAKVVIVAFEDFQCPFCKKNQDDLKKIWDKYGDKILFIYRDFPIPSVHPEAENAAEAANCAFQQGKFWEYHDQLFARQDELSASTYSQIAETLGLDISAFNRCLNTKAYSKEIEADIKAGQDLGVIGTPTFFINGQMFPGVLSFDFMDKVITLLLR
jgi:protein-disulfide isomerase